MLGVTGESWETEFWVWDVGAGTEEAGADMAETREWGKK